MGLHLVINVLSTVILAATNYCMQCLGAPARADIDKAHAQRRWLEIASTQYPVFIAPSDTDFNKPLLNTTELECFFYPDDRWKIFECLDLIADGDFDYLTPQQCIDTFAVDYLSGRGALILLSNDLGDSNNTVLWAGFSDSGASYEPFGWMCESGEKDCDRDIDPENWSVWGAPWKYPALDVHFPGINHTTDSMRTDDLWKPEYCKSDFHTDLCLDINTLYLSLPYYLDKDELNDVLRDPDKWLNMSWAEEGRMFQLKDVSVVARGSRADLKSLWDLGIGSPASATLIEVGSANVMLMVLLANSPQLIVSVTYFLYNSLLTRMLLAAEYNDYATHRKPLRVSWPKGGQRSTYYLSLPYKFSLPLMAVAALLHWLISQSIFYVQVISIEFDGYINDVQFISACGYSPMGIIFAIIVGGLLLLTGPALGMKRLTSRMPLAGNCSAAISAVCHPPPDDKDAALKPVMWGEIVTEPTLNSTSTEADDAMVRPRGWNKLTATDDDTEYKPGPQIRAERAGSGISSDEYPHCSFTSQEVIPPNPIRLYT
ncbi:hypothetical protein FQN54_008789 [Arachnomyces sp. PD_36]|nr:hypothetical protein FQN54_008789 [Arachnomyces sp. PD_36]